MIPFYQKQNVLITGHTGFKGSWLSLMLLHLGAKVSGISLNPPTSPNHFDLIGLQDHMQDIRIDIRNQEAISRAMQECKPSLVFHLAAETLVLDSYFNPLKTFEVNVQGTANVLEAIRKTPSVKAVVVITTDKVYLNNELGSAFAEEDPLGAADPYSTSKAMTELLAESYYKSFFKQAGIGVATARAGNVIGGGDFADNRLVPDCMRALFANKPIHLRNPGTKRPWMHVLDPLSGYLLLGAKLFENPLQFSSPFNFGPVEKDPLTCQDIAQNLINCHGKGSWHGKKEEGALQEKTTLQLASNKASRMLGFKPIHTIQSALQDTYSWYEGYYNREKNSLLELSLKGITNFNEEFQAPYDHLKSLNQHPYCTL